jgi:hypothetical protein
VIVAAEEAAALLHNRFDDDRLDREGEEGKTEQLCDQAGRCRMSLS